MNVKCVPHVRRLTEADATGKCDGREQWLANRFHTAQGHANQGKRLLKNRNHTKPIKKKTITQNSTIINYSINSPRLL